jgi:hypothetical protein
LEAAIDETNSGHWTRGMSGADRAVFESVAGEELFLAGYGVSCSPRRLAMLERARWIAQDGVHWLYWRVTTWDRGPRARTTVILIRAWVAGVLRQARARG